MDKQHAKEVLDFLNSIEGHGYGGMATFEIARRYMLDEATAASSGSFHLRREAAAEYIRGRHGMVCTRAWLARLAISGDGPPFRKSGRQVYYDRVDLDIWVASKLGEPVTASKDHPKHPSNHSTVNSGINEQSP